MEFIDQFFSYVADFFKAFHKLIGFIQENKP